MKGYIWAGSSIGLASIAQLLMKWGMVRLPQQLPMLETIPRLFDLHWLPLLTVTIGILCYLFSMLFWFNTLRYLPLNKAYPLLSISYGVVYLGVIGLPWFNESFSLIKTAGVLAILIGVWLINTSSPKQNR